MVHRIWQLQHFLAVAEQERFTRAVERARIMQSARSTSIQLGSRTWRPTSHSQHMSYTPNRGRSV